MLGSILENKYRIVRQLGAGAMGAVYEAEHTGTGRRVAVKVITGALAQDQALVSRFHREARAAGAIDTKHITQVLDTGVDQEQGLPFMVMEFLSGEDLHQFLKRSGPIAPELALRIIAQACLGLQKAHDAGVVHRDIKPANLFLARSDGEIIVKVLDFGIAKVKMDQAQETESAGLTRTGNMLGSPLYMSPEQARGAKAIDHRADIWSLGVALYQALAGRTPYHHITAFGELILAICGTPPPPVQHFAPWVRPEVAAIVHGALRHNPDERFQSAAAMLAAIRPLLQYGWTIQEEMLLPLGDTARSMRASHYPVPGSARSSQPGAPSAAAQSYPSYPPGTPAMTSHPGYGSNPSSASSQTGLSNSVGGAQAPGTPAKSSKLAAIMGAVVATAILGAGGFFVVTRVLPGAPPAPAADVVKPAATAPPAITPSTPPPPAPTPTTAPEPSAPETKAARRVRVVIVPADARVEVEGKLTPIPAGILEIEGKLGSVHRVRVRKGQLDKFEDVIVTEAGPSIPKIELVFGAAPSKPQPSATPSAAPQGVMKDFE